MRVLFDHQAFANQDFGGISRYFFELFKQFSQDPEVEPIISVSYSNNSYIINDGRLGVRSIPLGKLVRARYKLQSVLNQPLTKRELRQQDYDLFHPTYYNGYFLKALDKKPFVLTIYDMISELHFANTHTYDPVPERKRELASRAALIIAISERTKSDIVELLGIPESKIRVIYLSTSLNPADRGLAEGLLRRLPFRYILYVGIRNLSYKNFQFFFHSLAPLLKSDRELHLVCAGGRGFTASESKMIDRSGVKNQVHHFSVDDSTLAALYHNALAFVLPSLHEGFGMPVLESWACQCPVIVSKRSCLPEIAGDAAEYFDPEDIESIQDAVSKVIYREFQRKLLIDRGLERLKMFDWERTAAQTKRVYEEVLSTA